MSDIRDCDGVLRFVKDNKIRFIRLWFTDVLGYLKSFAITPSELEEALNEGMGFDGSSVEGFARIEESDLIARPDPSTLQILPWANPQYGRVARMICDIHEPDGSPCQADPRYALKRMLERAKQMGYTFYVGPELEYFYLKTDRGVPETLDEGGYFDLTPHDVCSDLRRETVLTLEQMGIGVEYSHHEVAPSQHEIDLRYTDALTMADAAITYRLVVKEVAQQHGVYATFMPKPILGANGSGMHTHQSLFAGDRNAFWDDGDEMKLSTVARGYIAGLLKHAQAMTAVICQWVNSYKRLVPGYEAPVYVSWARRNRSTMVRVPMYKPNKERATRIEFRAPDPACNPYLAFAVMLAAGLDGIEKGYELPPAVEEDIYQMPEAERQRRGIDTLPDNLYAAIELAEQSALVREALGDRIFDSFIANKRIEWDRYRIHVTQFELDRYLPLL